MHEQPQTNRPGGVNYHDAVGTLPMGVTIWQDGPLVSGSLLLALMPYMEQNALFNAVNYNWCIFECQTSRSTESASVRFGVRATQRWPSRKHFLTDTARPRRDHHALHELRWERWNVVPLVSAGVAAAS